jgi:plasmid stability protein
MHHIDIRRRDMAAMTIRKLSDAAAANIKLRAKANGRSAEAEARLALEEKFSTKLPFRSVAEAVEEFKRKHGGGFDLPYIPRSKDPIEPADFE